MQKFHFSFKIRWTLPSMESINPSKTHGEKPWLNSQPQSTLIGGAKTCKTTPYEFLQNYGLNLDSPTKIFPSKKKSLKPFAQEIPVTSPKTNRRDNGKTKTNHLKMYIYIYMYILSKIVIFHCHLSFRGGCLLLRCFVGFVGSQNSSGSSS